MRIIAGAHKGRILKTTSGPGFRPAMGIVRESLFSMLESRGVDWQHTRVLDLFAGSGSLGFEALSRGAAFTCFVESAAYAVKVLSANMQLLDIAPDRARIMHTEVRKALSKPPVDPYQLVFIDPPYAINALASTIALLLKHGWLADGAIVNAEVEAKSGMKPETIDTQLHVIADRAYGQTRVVLWSVNLK